MNKSGMRPIAFRILVKLPSAEEITKGGIIIPQKTADREKKGGMEAEVIEIGPSVWEDYDELGEAHEFEVGDTIVMPRYSGTMFDAIDGVDYRMVELKDIVGVKT